MQITAQDAAPLDIRQQAAVQFKNFVKYRWSPTGEEEDTTAKRNIADDEKEQIKGIITELMLKAPPQVRLQLSEALTIISSHDFPRRWPTLLPQLLEKMQTEDPSILNGVLTTADSIYQRYRGQFLTEKLNKELEYSQQLVRPLLTVAQQLQAHCKSAVGDELPLHFKNAQLTLSIFYSLNSPGLTEEFENTLQQWMECIHEFLALPAPPSLKSRDPDTESDVDVLKATACESLSLFMERNEDEFSPYLERSAQDVWQLLMTVGPEVGQDSLAMSAIAFLTTVARSVHHSLFGDPNVLKQVCEGIVIPNVKLREQDIEMFELNWVEYIRRDTEGSDSDTRRRAASELVRALVEKFPQRTTELFSNYVASLLSEASSNIDTGWMAKDAAIFLVTALTAKGRTAAAGATATNELVDLRDFFVTHIKPEIFDSNKESRPIIKADCLKFATVFRSHLPKEESLQLFSQIARLLTCTHNVVHSYAATLMEKLLLMRQRDKSLVFSPAELSPYLQSLLENLFAALQLPESSENEYVMRAVMRLVAFVGAAIAPVASVALRSLCDKLLEVSKNPTQPGFNHYLFESIAALIKYGCQGDASSIASYEEAVFPPVQWILQHDVQEFHPYVFQILAQLVELRSPVRAQASIDARAGSLPESYLQLLSGLLSPVLWERSGNIPALGRLVRSYVAAIPSEIVSRGLLDNMLGVFQKLIASKAQDHEGIALLESMIVHIDEHAMSKYMTAIWTLLFQRLQVASTLKISRCFLHLVALMAAVRGGAAVTMSMDTVQQNISVMITEKVLAPTLAGPGTYSDEKVIFVGFSRMLCESPSLQKDDAAGAQAALLGALAVKMAGYRNDNEHAIEGDEEEGPEEFTGYSAAYAKLHNAPVPEIDLLPGVKDAQADVAGLLTAFAGQNPGRLQKLVAHLGDDKAQTAVRQLLQHCNIS